MKKIAFIFSAFLCLLSAQWTDLRAQKIDTVYVSRLYTTHLIFSTDLTYADLSDMENIMAKIVEQSKNTFALRAKQPFQTTASVSMLESNGVFHTFILRYCEQPDRLVLDLRDKGRAEEAAREAAAQEAVPVSERGVRRLRAAEGTTTQDGSRVSALRKEDAPKVREVWTYPRNLFHLTKKYLRVRFTCENIIAYSDITYITVSVENRSGVSYEADQAMFVVEDNNRDRRKVKPEPVYQEVKGSYGSLTAPPGTYARATYSFPKITLTKDQVLNIYLYEKNGQRNLMLTLSPDDVNLASMPSEIKK